MRRLFVWLARIAGGIVLLLLVAVVFGWIWLRTSLPEIDGTRQIAGIEADVVVSRDRHGVPTIEARTAKDAYFALGYVHAQDRLAQMEFMRRFGAGRLSELIGSSALGIDQYMRTMGLYRLAEDDFQDLSRNVREAFVAYAAGVNSFLDNRAGALPPELSVLWHEPEPWKPADSLVWGRLMAMRLTGNWNEELLHARMKLAFSSERFEQLWPADETPGSGSSPAQPDESPSSRGGAVPESSDDTLVPNPDDGSNAWVIGASRSRSGFPILANDPHLGLTLPNIWYLARIDTPEFSLAGATTPGVPLHILGRNANLAWGLTTTHGDAADLYMEQYNGDHYDTPEGPKPFTRRLETIRVRFGDPVKHVVRHTRHGPIVSDIVPAAATLATPDAVLSLAHTALLPGDLNAEAMYRVNHAENMEQLQDALSRFRSPQQNVMFAFSDGTIGMQVTGLAPIRGDGDGFVPAPGSTGAFDWTGFIPFSEMPRIGDPDAGYVVNANNDPTPAGYPHFLARDWPDPSRAARIEEVLRRDLPASVQTSAGLQLDVRSVRALELKNLLVTVAAESDSTRRVLDILHAWDGSMGRNMYEPLIYNAWLRELYGAIFADEVGDVFPTWMRDRPRTLQMALTRNMEWCDNIGTEIHESCGPVLGRALELALDRLKTAYGDDMSNWRWGAVHQARFRGFLFGRIPVLRDFLDLVIETDGGNFTVNRGGFDIGDQDQPFADVHGAGYRAVYDLSDPDRSRMMIAAGQSGNPFSPWYDDLLEPWRDGEYLEMAQSTNPAHRLVLVPSEDSP